MNDPDTAQKGRRWPRIVAVAVVVLGVLTVILGPRFLRCNLYSKIISNPDARRNLAAHVKPIQVDYSKHTDTLEIGYGHAALPVGWIARITRQHGAILINPEDEESLVLMPPFYDSQLSADGDYSWTLAAAQTTEVAMAEVFFMSFSDFETLFSRTLAKANNGLNENGIGVFETDNIRGIIRYGARDTPGCINVAVWSKHGEVCQGIIIRATSSERALQLAQCVLFHLQYSVDHVPPTSELKRMIDNAITKNERFSAHPGAE